MHNYAMITKLLRRNSAQINFENSLIDISDV